MRCFVAVARRLRDGQQALIDAPGRSLARASVNDRELHRAPQPLLPRSVLATRAIFTRGDRSSWFMHDQRTIFCWAPFFFFDICIFCIATRYAAGRVFSVARGRLQDYALSLHPNKTRLMSSAAMWRPIPSGAGLANRAGTFQLLGFTFFCAKSRSGAPETS